MKIIIAGGSGFLGDSLIKMFNDTDTKIVVLTRKRSTSVRANVSYIQWDAKNTGAWAKQLEGSEVVFNLVGKSVNCRYTEKNKKEIIDSRVDATTVIGKAIQECVHPPKVWINAGSAAIYGDTKDSFRDEESNSLGEGFSSEVCKLWENAFYGVSTPLTRKVFLRIGLVFEKEAWVLKPFINMAKWGLGGKIGSGEQYVSWIHEVDFLNIIRLLLKKDDLRGTINCVSPNPVKNVDFMKSLRHACNVPFGIPHPAVFIKLGAAIIGTEAELVLTGRRVISKVLEKENFKFIYPDIDSALNVIMKKA